MPDLNTRNTVIPLLVFMVLLIMSVVGWKFASDTLDKQSRNRFEQEANHLHEQIQARFDTYAQVLRGGAGLFRSSETVTRNEWYHYVNGLELSRYFPGIQGVGFSSWIGGTEELTAHEAALRAEGFPDYAVQPAGEREEYTAVVYLEPFGVRNRRAFGYDMFSEDTRRSAMERARDTGEPALSGKVQLLQEISAKKQAGFLLYLPVYGPGGVSPKTVADRRATLSGFVYSPFRADNLMKGILQQGVSTISFRIYDESPLIAESILYDGAAQLKLDQLGEPVQFETEKTVTIAGRRWLISYSSTPSFTKTTDSALPWALLATGVLLSLLMSIIAWMLLSARRRVTQSTRELRKQEEINTVLLENLAEGVVACDADFNVIMLNKKAREWYLMDPTREPDLNWAERVQMFEKDGTTPVVPGNSPLFRAVAGAVIQSEEVCIVAQGQAPRYVLINGGPLPEREGLKPGAVLSLRDITEYRSAMKNIERQQNFLADVIDNIPNLISARDRNGNHVLANRAYAESVHGVSPETLLAANDEDEAIDWSPEDGEMQENIAVMETGVGLNFVRDISLLNGQRRWFSVGKLPIRSNESSDIIVLTVASDITELKLSEERVRTMNQELESRVRARTTSLEEANQQLEVARQVAENANLAKSSFLAAMSHEIRTPMNGVVGMVEVLMNESTNKDLMKSLQMVLDSAFSLLGIIDDILDFSKIEAGHFELENTPVNLTELVESVVRTSVPLARKANSTVTLYIDPDIPERVLVDVTRFRQVLTNLVGNAIKFSGQQPGRGGHVEVRASALHAEPLTLQLEVIDNGVGMSSTTQQHIFESFVQAESSITRRFGGSGLGLAICKRIVDMMRGEILVESVLGEGSTFTVVLSLDVLQAEPQVAGLENIEDVDCVLMDSDDYNSADIRKYLETAGANVYEVADSELAAETIDAVGSSAVVLCSSAHLKQPASDAGKAMRSGDTDRVVLSREENSLGMDIRRVSLMHGATNEYISAVVVDYNALRRKTLIESVAIAIGRASPEVMHAYAEETAMPTLEVLSVEEAMAAGSCILVVEDDSVNRMVIRRQLRLLGQTAEFAENGSEALQKWRDGSYGLVFTDLHMPIMDGYTMTRTIRQEEAEGVRIPIVALTANALSGEPRRAADAGVDGYLTKPLQLSSLKDAISQYLVLSGDADTDIPLVLDEQSEDESAEVMDFDPKALRRLLGDDPEIITECLEEFLISLDKVGNKLVDSIRSEDWVSVDQLAHRLKSSSLSIGALEVWRVCKAIETSRSSDGNTQLVAHADDMVLAIECADSAINRFLAGEASGDDYRKAS